MAAGSHHPQTGAGAPGGAEDGGRRARGRRARGGTAVPGANGPPGPFCRPLFLGRGEWPRGAITPKQGRGRRVARSRQNFAAAMVRVGGMVRRKKLCRCPWYNNRKKIKKKKKEPGRGSRPSVRPSEGTASRKIKILHQPSPCARV